VASVEKKMCQKASSRILKNRSVFMTSHKIGGLSNSKLVFQQKDRSNQFSASHNISDLEDRGSSNPFRDLVPIHQMVQPFHPSYQDWL